MLTIRQKQELLKIARQSVEDYVKTGRISSFEIIDEELSRKCGAFVTLHEDEELRGCIGLIEPSDTPLWQVVRDMAIEAAAGDPRFLPVKEDELDKLEYEVSVLSIPEKIQDWHKIELGRHGVIVRQGDRSGVFLPQVAIETGWSLEEFLKHLCADKAGLESDCYLDQANVDLYIFTAEVFFEKN